jgi:hypothetical protein
VSDRYRVERHDEFDGTSTWHVFDDHQGDQPVAEFDDEQAAPGPRRRARGRARHDAQHRRDRRRGRPTDRPVTFSIVARDPATGLMGVATQTQALAVGASVPWAVPGYGVIATQSMGEPMYGELGLDLLRNGLTASEVLAALQTIDETARAPAGRHGRHPR